MPQGIIISYFSNGNKTSETPYKNAKKMKEGTNKEGKYDGRRLAYYERGRKIADTKYENGELVNRTVF